MVDAKYRQKFHSNVLILHKQTSNFIKRAFALFRNAAHVAITFPFL